jgi:ABC-type dipeptide/oligopeptide/nickel transport system permease subunit
VAAAVRPSLPVVCLVIGLVGWAGMARLVRGQVLVTRGLDYVQAARALGASDGRLVARHVLPNVLGPVIVAATLGVGGAIMAEAALSFVGLGAQPPTPSWGAMIAEGRDLLRVAPWVSLFPGLAIGLTVMGVNLVGDGLRDALDIRA